MPSAFPYTAKRRVEALIDVLKPLVEKDPEQEIRGIAVPVFEAAMQAIRDELPDENPVVAATKGAYAHEIETGEPVRCADALLVATQLDAVIGDRPPPTPRSVRLR